MAVAITRADCKPTRPWQLKTVLLKAQSRPYVMGIVNVTPDSFSDGGQFWRTSAAIEHGLRLAREGADIIDVGGESTRPYSEPVSAAEELRRTIPVITGLVGQTDVPISIDTSKAAVAQEAVAAGAQIINDVTGLTGDVAMVPLAVETRAGLCVMHMQGTPRTMQDQPRYAHVVSAICDYLSARRDALIAAGVDAARICLDPGLGFGKTQEHNLQLLRELRTFHALGCPLLIGHSRKGFLAKLISAHDRDLTAASIGVTLAVADQGAHVVRVHDVRATVDALTTFVACRSAD